MSVRLVRSSASKKAICIPSILAALHYLFAKRDEAAANAFVHDIQNGANLDEEDGVYVLRERLLRESYMKSKILACYVAALGIKAWNARRANRAVRILKYDEREQFPLIAD